MGEIIIHTGVGKYGPKDKVVQTLTTVLKMPLILFKMPDPLAVRT